MATARPGPSWNGGPGFAPLVIVRVMASRFDTHNRGRVQAAGDKMCALRISPLKTAIFGR